MHYLALGSPAVAIGADELAMQQEILSSLAKKMSRAIGQNYYRSA